jgi:hypothetical protein
MTQTAIFEGEAPACAMRGAESPAAKWTRESIVALLDRSDEAVERALLRILRNQTSDEQASERAAHRNGVGFGSFDAEIFTSFAFQVQSGRHLSPRQLAICRKRDSNGTMKLGKYWRQLLAFIERTPVAA